MLVFLVRLDAKGVDALDFSDHLNGHKWFPLIETLVHARNWKEMAQVIAEHLKNVLPYDRLSCSLIHLEEQVAEIIVPLGEVNGLVRSGERLSLEGTATGWVVQNKRPLLETDGQEFTTTFANVKAKGFRTRLAVPIESGDKIIAALVFHKREPNAYSERDVKRIQSILPIIAALIQRMKEQWQLEQALEREKETRRKIEILNQLNTRLLSGEPMDKFLQSLADLLRPFIPFDRFSISLYDELTNREWLYVLWHDGFVWEAMSVKPFVHFGAAKEVMRMGKPLIRPQLDPKEFPAEKWLVEQGFRSALVYPLKMRERFKATFNFSSRQVERFNESHVSFLNEIAEQISITLHSLFQEQEVKEYSRLREGLLQLSMDLLLARSVGEIFSAVNERLRMLGVDYLSFIVRLPEGILREVVVLPDGVSFKDLDWLPQPIREGETILSDILLGKREIFFSNDPINEVSEIERQFWLQVLGGEIYQFGNAVVPIRGYTGILGAICVDFRENRRFFSTQDELINLIQTIGNLTGIALENIWLEEKLQRQLKETRVLHRLILEASSGSDLKQLAQSLVETLPMILPCHSASVLFLDEEKEYLDFVATYPEPPPDFPLGFRLPINVGIIGYVARTGKPVLEKDVRTNPYYFAVWSGTLSELCVPIKVGEEVVGVINMESQNLAAFDERHLVFMQTLAAQLGTIMERNQLLKRQTKLAQQLSVIFEGILEGVALISPDGKIEDANRRFGDLVGLTAEKLRNQSASLLVDALLRRATDPIEMKDVLDASLSDQTQPVFDTLTLTSPECVLERYCVPVWLPDGTLAGQLWVLRDVTEERQRQHEILRLERLRTLGELASGIAHDLNNALSPILGGADLLRQMTEGEAQTIAETIYRSVQYATDIIKRLQSFYRTTAIGVQTNVDVHQLLLDAVSLTRPRWQDAALAEGVTIRVETQLANEPAMTKGIPAELRQVFINLIINAADAIVERAKVTDNREGLIRIVTECTHKHIIVRFIDDGIGMTEEVQRQAFEAFFTTKGEKGAGLGLSIALATITVHGGSINLQSRPMEGTTVTVTLPLVQPTIVSTEPTPSFKLEFPRWRVLVVDDQYLVMQTVAAQLQRLGMEVVTARHGSEGWEFLQREKFDLVVTDLSMPVMNGIELATKIREKFPELPVIMLTGWGEFVPHQEIQSLGVFAVLSKPIALQSWREILASLAEKVAKQT
ncbi:MAG: GAF domain-containing protein [Armatimonadetes bacterium]|nr:GAF domain-containing protein [Armatimonadota bacterium]MDW8027091.1 GAF domain-containing protein [Armatimonadota bacterium]